MYLIVRVTWIDSHQFNDWRENAVQVALARTLSLVCETTGYLVLDEPDRVGIAQSISEDGNMSEVMVIPRVAITEIEELHVGQ